MTINSTELQRLIGNLLGIFLIAGMTGIIFGLLGLGIGFLFMHGTEPLGLGIVAGVLGFGWGAKGGVHTVIRNETIRQRNNPHAN